MPFAFKQVKNNAKTKALSGVLNNTTNPITFGVTEDEGDNLPQPGAGFWVTVYNKTLYPDPGDDPNMRIGLVTARTDDDLTVSWVGGTPATAVTGQPNVELLVLDQHFLDIYAALDLLRKINDPVFNVMEYGALGDGTTVDNTAVLAALVDLNAAGGGKLLFPAGYNFVLTPTIQLSSNTTVVIAGATITLNPAYTNVGTTFKGIFRIGTTSGTGIVENTHIEGGTVEGDCFSAQAWPSPTFNTNDHKRVCFIHSVNTLINCTFHDFKSVNMGSPCTLEKMGGVNGTPSRNTHVYNVVQEASWVGVQMYCNGYLAEDCSVHDIDTKYCYDDAVAICGGAGGVVGAGGIFQRVQVYNIRGEKTGQVGGFVKIDCGNLQSGPTAPMTDIQVWGVNGYTQGVNEGLVDIFKASNGSTKKIILTNLQGMGSWNYGVYAQTNGRSLRIENFQFEALYDIHLQFNATPNVSQNISIVNGTGTSRDASLADTIEGSGLSYSAGTGTQGIQNVYMDNVSFRNKSIPINEGTTGLPGGTGSQGAYKQVYYGVDVRNSLFSDCVFTSTSRRVRVFKEGVYQLITPPTAASDPGTKGDITWDASFMYVCTATDTWKRAAVATW